MAGACVTVPALYIAGDHDLVLAFRGMDQITANLSESVPQLRGMLIRPGCGYWTQQYDFGGERVYQGCGRRGQK